MVPKEKEEEEDAKSYGSYVVARYFLLIAGTRADEEER